MKEVSKLELPLWLRRRIRYGYASSTEIENFLSHYERGYSYLLENRDCPGGCRTGCSKVYKCIGCKRQVPEF